MLRHVPQSTSAYRKEYPGLGHVGKVILSRELGRPNCPVGTGCVDFTAFKTQNPPISKYDLGCPDQVKASGAGSGVFCEFVTFTPYIHSADYIRRETYGPAFRFGLVPGTPPFRQHGRSEDPVEMTRSDASPRHAGIPIVLRRRTLLLAGRRQAASSIRAGSYHTCSPLLVESAASPL
jgi:hypothetical protein